MQLQTPTAIGSPSTLTLKAPQAHSAIRVIEQFPLVKMLENPTLSLARATVKFTNFNCCEVPERMRAYFGFKKEVPGRIESKERGKEAYL
jgi:hypothetical protein